MRRRLLWFAFGFVGLLVIATIGGGLSLRYELRASLPIVDGSLAMDELEAAVSVDRDALGVPTISAKSRVDAARALGFLHAQDRFFQMDMQRRQAAGELAGLVGERALPADRAMRVHRFRHIARQAVERAAPTYRAVLEAYAGGVNAGLAALGARPFEYLLLRAEPEAWQPEDSILTILAMFNTLQGRQAGFESTFGSIADAMPPQMFELLTARGSEWDAPVVGEKFVRPAIPGPDVFDLRNTETRTHRNAETISQNIPCVRDSVFRDPVIACELTAEEASGIGSNNWAVAGSHTTTGVALVANDMHLAINVPNIWYRASLAFPDPRSPAENIRVTGVTLPGIPSVVVGSNGHVAWGFTNTGGDWSDLVIVEPDAREPEKYLTPSGLAAFERFSEPINVHGGKAEPFEAEWTIWGPVIRTDARGRKIAQHWVAHDVDRLSADITGPELARTLDEALRTAAGLGIPAQNFVAGDTSGRIGWTIAGPIPRRVGFDGRLPSSWADGSHAWNGYLTADEQPRVIDPPGGRVWTANAPVVTNATLGVIGEGGYADGIRARIIRDRLMAIDKATASDMLSVQLETSALFHERWRALLLDTLTPAAVRDHAPRAEFRRLIESTWSGRAEPASTAYLLVRTFRAVLAREVFGALTRSIKDREPSFEYERALRSEGPLWQLVTEKPRHLLNPASASWDAQLLAAVDTTITELTAGGKVLAEQSWGAVNRAIVAHPLGAALPFAARYMNMPPDPLPGDVYAPRAHSPRTGPSERMAVSPGREQEGILHMPGGQSGHPLSPHYADQHHAWVSGDPLPFLPGRTVSHLTLTPAR